MDVGASTVAVEEHDELGRAVNGSQGMRRHVSNPATSIWSCSPDVAPTDGLRHPATALLQPQKMLVGSASTSASRRSMVGVGSTPS